MARREQRPTEFYGIPVTATKYGVLQDAIRSQHCPYLGTRCDKSRKGDRTQTIGSCSVDYQGGSLIVCPHRLLENDQVFLNAVPLLRPRCRYVVVPEIAMPGGSVDFFVVAMDGSSIVDYVGLETQALDTTGTGGVWDARNDLLAGKLAKTYGYGINWKMSAKTILMQMHHKGPSFSVLRRKLVLAVQTEFFKYIGKEFRSKHVRSAMPTDPVHFHLYDFVSIDGGRRIVLTDRKSTDVAGIEEMLKLGERPEITEAEVLERIEAKLPDAKALSIL